MPVVVFSTENELPKKLAQAKEAADLVIIDTPPARSTEAPAAVEIADLVLIPTTPDVEPLEQMPRTLRLCRGFSRPPQPPPRVNPPRILPARRPPAYIIA